MKVVNVRKDEYAVYIGRADNRIGESKDSPWCNPFHSETKEINIEMYRQYARDNYNIDLVQRSLTGKRCGCWCNDDNCHGQVLRGVVEHGKYGAFFKAYVYEERSGGKKVSHRQLGFRDPAKYKTIYGKMYHGKLVPLFVSVGTMFGNDWHPSPDYSAYIGDKL